MILLFFLAAFLVFTAFTHYYAKNWSRELFVTLSFLRDFAYEGEEILLTEKIENKKKLPIPILELGFQLQKGLTFRQMENAQVSDFLYKKDIFSLLGFQRITRKLLLDCNHRGYYYVFDLQCIGYSLFIRHKYMIDLPCHTDFYVYPKRVDVSDILLSYNQLMGSRQVAKQLYEDPFAFHAIREYTMSDPMKTINWKASAKTGNLMVNTFDSTLTGKVMIYLDVNERRMRRQDFLIEEAISIAASLVYKFTHQGMKVGLAVNILDDNNNNSSLNSSDHGTGDTSGNFNDFRNYSTLGPSAPSSYKLESSRNYFLAEPAVGNSHMTKIEQALAKIDLTGEMLAYEEILRDERKDSLPIFITKNEELLPSILKFCGKDLPGIFVFLTDRQENISIPSRQNNLAIIHREVTMY